MPHITPNRHPHQRDIDDLGLSAREFERYQKLDAFSQAKIIDFLKERNRLNGFVKQYLEEKINLNILIQLLFPTEHSLRYALQKVDQIEQDINLQLDHNEQPLFDKNTTKENRSQILLSVAHAYKDALQQTLNTYKKNEIPENLTQKFSDLNMIIEELEVQIDRSEFNIHNKAILKIKDADLGYFINKLKTIGITGFQPKSTQKEQSTFFRISILSALYERFTPDQNQEPENDQEDDQKKSDDRPFNPRRR
ncbi:MAG: hypothetical protein CK424_07870 [Legionella sp.]|nr:MAG: hypothetical protein CK424_07870 [Legionella sp.]